MRQLQINKLYTKLKPEELAALAFEESIRGNEDEFDLILGSVKHKDYTGPDIIYLKRLEGLRQFSMFYGIFFWKRLCQIATAPTLANDNVKVDEQWFIDDFTSMNAAFESTCQQLGVDASIVRKFVECGNYRSLTDGKVKENLVSQYVEFFKKIIIF